MRSEAAHRRRHDESVLQISGIAQRSCESRNIKALACCGNPLRILRRSVGSLQLLTSPPAVGCGAEPGSCPVAVAAARENPGSGADLACRHFQESIGCAWPGTRMVGVCAIWDAECRTVGDWRRTACCGAQSLSRLPSHRSSTHVNNRMFMGRSTSAELPSGGATNPSHPMRTAR